MEKHVTKRFRQGRILQLIGSHGISNQLQLRRQLAGLGVRVTQATLSRDLQDLKIVKTGSGYRTIDNVDQGKPALATVQHALKEFLLDMRPAENLLVLKTPPGGAQPLAAAIDAERWKEVAGTLAGDDTVLIISPRKSARAAVQKRMEEMLR